MHDLAELLFPGNVSTLGDRFLGGRALLPLVDLGIDKTIEIQTKKRVIHRFKLASPEAYVIALSYINAARLIEEQIPVLQEIFSKVKDSVIAKEALEGIVSKGRNGEIEINNPKARKLLVKLGLAQFQEPVITISEQQREKLKKRLEQAKNPNQTVRESTATARVIKDLANWLEKEKKEKNCEGISLEETRKQLGIILKQYVAENIIRKNTVNNTKHLILPISGESDFFDTQDGVVTSQKDTATTQFKTRIGYEETLITAILSGKSYNSLYASMRKYGKGTFYHYISRIAELGCININYPIAASPGNRPPLIATTTGHEVYNKLMEILSNSLEVEKEMDPTNLYEKLTLWDNEGNLNHNVLPALKKSIEWAANRLRAASEYYIKKNKPSEFE